MKCLPCRMLLSGEHTRCAQDGAKDATWCRRLPDTAVSGGGILLSTTPLPAQATVMQHIIMLYLTPGAYLKEGACLARLWCPA